MYGHAKAVTHSFQPDVLHANGHTITLTKARSRSRSQTSLLRLVTAGSVDDGKSTLIGRLLYDARAIPTDQLAAITEQNNVVNFARLTDGLRAERRQGITIDVAYRYWETDARKFIIADSPGHVQYTRNMVTAASNAEVALVVVDCRNDLLDQTRRHLYLTWLLGVRDLVVCVNKMDLVDYQKAVFDKVKTEINLFSQNALGGTNISFIPVSALHGDNILHPSRRMPWYEGLTLLKLLEQVPVGHEEALAARFIVQLAVREESAEYRGYAGQIASGQFTCGDEVIVCPSGIRTRIKSIRTYDGELPQASAPRSVVIEVDDHLDISRGDVIVPATELPIVSQRVQAHLCWMDEAPSSNRKTYLLKHGSLIAKARIEDIDAIETFHAPGDHPDLTAESLKLNQIGKVALHTAVPLVYDPYRKNRITGAFILIDENTHATSAAGMLLAP